MPFHRFYEMVSGRGGSKSGQGFVNNSSPIKHLKGSDREIISPFESIIKNTFLMRDLAERNMVAANFVDSIQGVQGSGKIAEPFFRKMKPTELKTQEIERIIRDSGVLDNLQKIDANGNNVPLSPKEKSAYLKNHLLQNPIYNVIMREVDATDPKNGVFKVWKNGKPEYWQLSDKELYRALTMLDSKEVEALKRFPLAKLVEIPSRLLRAGAILDPNFAVKNPIRDQFDAYLFSKNNYIPFYTALSKGFFEVLFKGKYFKEWQRAGGRFADFTSVDRVVSDEVLKDILKDKKDISRYFNPIGYLRNFSEKFEQMTRVAEYRNAREHGKGMLEAANESKEITLNYSRAGKYGRIMNRYITFFNAAIQGTDKIAREFLNPRNPNIASNWLKGLLGVTMGSIAIWLMNKDDAEIRARPAWEKRNFWLFRLPGSDELIRVPKPFLAGDIFATLPEAILDFMQQKDPKLIQEFAAEFLGGNNPFSLPPIVSVPMDIANNRSSFTGAPLEGHALQSLLPSQRANASTSTSSAVFVDWLAANTNIQVSPVKIDYAVQGFTGGLGKLAMGASDTILSAFSDLDLPATPDGGWKRLPVAKSFNVNPLSSNKYVGQFYEQYNELNQRIASAQKILDGKIANNSLWVRCNIEQLQKDEKDFQSWKEIADKLRICAQAEKTVRLDKSRPADQKYKKLQYIVKIKNDTAQKFIESLSEQKQK